MTQFRTDMGLAEDPAALQLDSAGLKKLFSHGLRRFKSRSRIVQLRLHSAVRYV